ncbi:MAG: ATP synthase F1 subunit epsilon [Candidatus Omnitrophota bacterium]
MNRFPVEIISPEKKVFQGEAEFLGLPGKEGELGITPGHIPFISALKPGKVKLTQNGQDRFWDISGGMLHISREKTTVLFRESSVTP